MNTQLKERPLVLTTEEVNAVLAGHKTQHRMPFDFEFIKDVNVPIVQKVADETDCTLSELVTGAYNDSVYDFVCPFGKVGDRLWVQEDHRPIGWAFEDGEVTIEYRDGKRLHPHYLTEEELETNPNDDYPFAVVEELLARNVPILKGRDCFDFSNPDNLPHWRSADVMPKFASRILLEVVDIRIERVQDITGGDAYAEGCPYAPANTHHVSNQMYAYRNASSWFAENWKEQYGEQSYLGNDWVWVIEFKKVDD